MKLTAKQNPSQSAYVKMLASYTALVAFALVALVILCYTLFNRSYSSEVQKAQRSAVQYEKNTFSSLLLDRGGQMVQTLTSDASNAALLRMPLNENRKNQVAVYQIYQKLVAFAEVNADMLEQVIVFYPQQDFCISSRSGYKILSQQHNREYLRLYGLLEKQTGVRAAWQFLLPGESALLENGSLAFAALPLWTTGGPAASPCAAFFIREDFLKDMVQRMAVEGQQVYLTDAQGRCVYASDGTAAGQKIENGVLSGMLETASGAALQSAADWEENRVFACSGLADTPLRIVVAMSVDSWRGSTEQIRLYLIAAGAAVLALALGMVLLVTRKLYSPLRVLRDLVWALPYVDSRNLKNEFSVISTGLSELSRLLSNTQRVLHVNQSLLKNQALLNLLDSQSRPAALETLGYLGIRFSGRYFSLLAVEYCEGDACRLDANTRQTLSVALVDTVEHSDAIRNAQICGFIPKTNVVCFLMNHAGAAPSPMETLMALVAPYFDCYDVRCYIAAGGEGVALGALDGTYAHAAALLAGRLYDPGPGPVRHAAASGGGGDFSAMLKRLESISNAGSDQELFRQLEEMVDALGRMSPVSAQVCLQRMLAILRGFMLARRPGQPLPPALLEPAACLWKLSELPALLRDALGAKEDEGDAGGDAAFMRAVVTYIDRHMAEDLSLETISEALHFSPKYFSRKFKKISGETVSGFLTVRRMEAASDLLRKTGLSLEHIAERTGYKTTQYFSRKFKEIYGVTPGEYRRAAGG